MKTQWLLVNYYIIMAIVNYLNNNSNTYRHTKDLMLRKKYMKI